MMKKWLTLLLTLTLVLSALPGPAASVAVSEEAG